MLAGRWKGKYFDLFYLLRYNLFCIFIISSMPTDAQTYSGDDTIKIREVLVTRKRFGNDVPGFKKIVIDSSVVRKYSNNSLAEILTENSGFFLKNYGPGGIATPSFRGTGASHTQIEWNGININSPMLGQSDFSIIPSGMIDEIEIRPGNASMELDNGGFGAIVNLTNRPDWGKKTVVTLSPEAGSFGRYAGFAGIKTGGEHFQSVTKVFLHSAENDFRYLNNINSTPYWETRKNSQMHQTGLMQEVYLKGTRNTLSARMWYQSASRNLPAPIIASQSDQGENQHDESLRILVNLDSYHNRIKYSLSSAGIITKLNYTNKLASVLSESITESLHLKGRIESPIGNFIRVKAYFTNDLHFVRTNNYSENTSRNTLTATFSAERDAGERFGIFFLFREIIDRNHILIPDFSGGFEFRFMPAKNYRLKGSIARNSKLPTMNDLFWIPGGNPDLKNESAFSYELSYFMDQKILKSVNLKSDITFFKNYIRDMIVWHPGNYSYWIPENIKCVNTTGLESSLSIDYAVRHFKLHLNAGYSYTRALSTENRTTENINRRRQLVYIPENLANTSVNLGLGNYYVTFVTNFVSKRYLTADNSDYLPGYSATNLSSGVRFSLNDLTCDMNFRVENLFNSVYQTVAYFPQPGRSYVIRIMLRLNK